jgi:hypothetical protein
MEDKKKLFVVVGVLIAAVAFAGYMGYRSFSPEGQIEVVGELPQASKAQEFENASSQPVGGKGGSSDPANAPPGVDPADM